MAAGRAHGFGIEWGRVGDVLQRQTCATRSDDPLVDAQGGDGGCENRQADQPEGRPRDPTGDGTVRSRVRDTEDAGKEEAEHDDDDGWPEALDIDRMVTVATLGPGAVALIER